MKRFLVFLFLGVSLNSCIPLPTEQGVCKTTEGDVDTYNIIGVWKKVPKTAKEELNFSNGNYRLLYIVQGNDGTVVKGDEFEGIDVYYNSLICEERVSNGVRTELVKKGLYFHDDKRTRILTNIVDLETDDDDPVEDRFGYRFSGNCLGTKLTLTDPSGDENTYTFVNNVVPSDACKLPETSN